MSFVARALVNPAVLDDSSGATSAAGLVRPRDRRRLKQFAGFITRVQHNFLWEAFPWTIRCLHYYGASLDTFTAYAAAAQSLRRAGASQLDRINAFTAFLEQRLENGTTVCPGLGDIIRHERAIWALRALGSRHALRASRPTAGRGVVRASSTFGRLVPGPARAFVVTAWRHDPVAIIARLTRNAMRRPPLVTERASRAMQDVLYTFDDASTDVSRATIDAVSAMLLCEINGRRSVAAILRRIARRSGIRIPAATARRVYESFADRGILYLGAPSRRVAEEWSI